MVKKPRLENLTVFQLFKGFSMLYGTLKFITAFTKSRNLSIFWDIEIKTMSIQPISSILILILSTLLRLSLSSGRFPSVFPAENLCATYCAHPIVFYLINRVTFYEDRKLINYRIVRKRGDIILILNVTRHVTPCPGVDTCWRFGETSCTLTVPGWPASHPRILCSYCYFVTQTVG